MGEIVLCSRLFFVVVNYICILYNLFHCTYTFCKEKQNSSEETYTNTCVYSSGKLWTSANTSALKIFSVHKYDVGLLIDGIVQTISRLKGFGANLKI